MKFKDSKILIIDDEPDICNQLSGLLNDIGYSCDNANTSEKGLEIFKQKSFSLVLLDIWLNNSKFDGFQALEKLQRIDHNIPVIMISGHGNIETAVNSIKKGAYDFIEKPFDSDLLIFKIKKAVENYILKKKIEKFSRKDLDSEIVAISKSSKFLENKIKDVSKTDSNILLNGDEGSGKEFVASKIHDYSHRSKKYLALLNAYEKLNIKPYLYISPNEEKWGMKEIKKIMWKGTEDWDSLLLTRAEKSGKLVLSDFTKNAIAQFKNK